MLMQEIRSRSQGLIAYILVGLIALVFALFGLGSITTFLVPTPTLLTVNGDDITEQEMLLGLERQRRAWFAEGLTPDEDLLRRLVLDGLVRDTLLTQSADRLHLYFGDAQVDQGIRDTVDFQVAGRFDPEQYRFIVAQAGFSPAGYREQLRFQGRYNQLFGGIAETDFLLPDESARAGELLEQTRDLAWLRLQVDELLDETELGEEDIRRYHEEHPATFTTAETVEVEYLELSRDAAQATIELSEEELLDWYERNQETYGSPEERQAAHILFEFGGEATPEAVRGKAEAAYARLQAGEDFAALAREISEDPGSADLGGDLGHAARGVYAEAFEEVLFRLAPDEIGGPVETPFGFHLIKLLDLREAEVPPFEEVREQLRADASLDAATELFVQESTRLAELVFEFPEDLRTAADELQLEIRREAPFTRSGGEGIAVWPEVVQAAFSSAVLLDGYNSDVIEVEDGRQLVVRLLAHRPSELQEFAEVADEAERLLRQARARELAIEKRDQAVAQLESGSIAAYVAVQAGVDWEVVEGGNRLQPEVDRAILDEAFRLPKPEPGGKSIGSLVLDGGDAVVVVVTRVFSPPVSDYDDFTEEEVKRNLTDRRGGDSFREYLLNLRELAKIVER